MSTKTGKRLTPEERERLVAIVRETEDAVAFDHNTTVIDGKVVYVGPGGALPDTKPTSITGGNGEAGVAPPTKIHPLKYPAVKVSSEWRNGGQDLWWCVAGKWVSDADLKAWCHQHLDSPWCYFTNGVVVAYHVNAWAAHNVCEACRAGVTVLPCVCD